MLRIDYLYQSNIVSALLISSEYQEMYTEKDYNHFTSVSFPIKSCFRYKSGRFDQTIDTNDVLIEAGDIEFQVFKFPTLTHDVTDVTLSFSTFERSSYPGKWSSKTTQTIERLKRTPQIEFLLRTFLAAYSKTSQLFIDELLHEILFQIVPDLQSTTSKSYDSNPWQSAKIDAAKDYIYTYSPGIFGCRIFQLLPILAYFISPEFSNKKRGSLHMNTL